MSEDGYRVLNTVTHFTSGVRTQSRRLYFLDLGKAEVNANPVYERSRVGVFVSICVLAILVFYLVFTTAQFAKGVPAIIYTALVPSQYRPLLSPDLGLVFRAASNSYEALNTSMLSVTFSQRTIYSQDSDPLRPRGKRVLETNYNCSFNQNIDPTNRTATKPELLANQIGVCANESVWMVGSYEMSLYKYLDIELQCRCPNDSTRLCPASVCIADPEFNRLILSGSISIAIIERIPSFSAIDRRIFRIIPNTNDLSRPPTANNYTRSLLFKPNKLFFPRVDIMMRRTTILNGPRFFVDSHYNDNFYTVGETDQRPDAYVDVASPTLFKAYVRLDSYDNEETRQSPQILQLVGSWGALWSFFSLTVLGLVRMYNTKIFERRQHTNKLSANLVMNNMSITTSTGLTTAPPSTARTVTVGNSSDIEMMSLPAPLHPQSSNNTLGRSTTPRNILHASSGSLDNFGWSPNDSRNSFSLNTSTDVNNNNLTSSQPIKSSSQMGSLKKTAQSETTTKKSNNPVIGLHWQSL
eukprot:gene6623-7698_t